MESAHLSWVSSVVNEDFVIWLGFNDLCFSRKEKWTFSPLLTLIISNEYSNFQFSRLQQFYIVTI